MNLIIITTILTAFFHTLFGPDHYVPFAVLAKAKKWSIIKTTWITILCGIAHVGSSFLLAIIVLFLGFNLKKIQIFQSYHGNISAIALTAFGIIYFIWGIRQAFRNKPHTHWHSHLNESHSHIHTHTGDHLHLPEEKDLSLWIFFIIFIFGPCEPLIPLLLYVGSKYSLFSFVFVASIFSIITIASMLALIIAILLGLQQIPFKKFDKFSHAIAGATIALCGFAILFLGL